MRGRPGFCQEEHVLIWKVPRVNDTAVSLRSLRDPRAGAAGEAEGAAVQADPSSSHFTKLQPRVPPSPRPALASTRSHSRWQGWAAPWWRAGRWQALGKPGVCRGPSHSPAWQLSQFAGEAQQRPDHDAQWAATAMIRLWGGPEAEEDQPLGTQLFITSGRPSSRPALPARGAAWPACPQQHPSGARGPESGGCGSWARGGSDTHSLAWEASSVPVSCLWSEDGPFLQGCCEIGVWTAWRARTTSDRLERGTLDP